MFKLKTPHRKPLAHALRFYGYFVYASLLVGMLMQSRFTIPIISTFGALFVTSSLAFIGGLIVTALVRWLFGLVQTGRVIQYAGFWAGSYAGVRVSQMLLPGVVWHSYAALSSLFIVVAAFGGAIYLKEVPWKGRTWLPVAKKRSGGRSKISIIFSRAKLIGRAEALNLFGSARSSRDAWKQLVSFETLHLPAGSSKRSHALTQLALSYMTTGGETFLLIARKLLSTAHENLVNDQGVEYFGIGNVAQIRGRVEQLLGNWEEAVKFHQTAEAHYLVVWPISYHRAHNLKQLARCLEECRELPAARWCDREAELLFHSLLLRPRRTYSY